MHNWKKKDPYFTREAQKYGQAIPSREYIMQCLEQWGKPMTRKELLKELELSDELRVAFYRRLRAMEREGQLMCNRRHAYGLIHKMDLVRGRVIGHREGYGFLVPDSGGEDLYLSAREMRPVLHGDRVVARIIGVDRRGRREGAIVEILERNNHRVVGRFIVEDNLGFLVPSNRRLNQDILISLEHQQGAKDNQIIIAEIIEQPTSRHQPVGRVVELLGDNMAPGMEVDIAIQTYELPYIWPEEVLAEAKTFNQKVTKEARVGRLDLRELPLVTIDGEDAQDFDDAVYAERNGQGWRLWVAIADVSWYVRPYSALDVEAQKRGNSVYFPNRVIPMLPEVLSNELCSLNPKVDRLCLVCEMEIGSRGGLNSFRFYPGVMRSAARLTYNQVAAMLLDRDQKLQKCYQAVLPGLESMYSLYQLLRKGRSRRGAIDFEVAETKIIFDKLQKIKDIQLAVRNDIHRLIEEFMILANVAAARFLAKRKILSLFRVHEQPAEDKLVDLRSFLAELGLELRGGDSPKSKDFSHLLQQIQGRSDAHLIQTIMLRSLKQAIYSPENNGHFGLALTAYTHFTSPIRRYPDLLVHRAIYHILAQQPAKILNYTQDEMVSLGEHCSMTERRADESTRDAVDWLKCEYMMDKIGECFDGLITGVTAFGLFVELCNVYVEGLIHVTALGSDYFHFDPVKHRLTGERTHKTYRLADKIRVAVVRVDLDEKKIDLELSK
ncbi:ribonuclease R [Candidatus Nitrosoglobus terrae]|uniref:Ribonuclease R n=1 Tax=Candidatus Nitrosoglobus terrae TaxID=1630141 RepID=A0A1Q2SKQ1_9GAMM|nr:ribonuclease R [Candidatus Nitrosoglobus terrae]BAW79694.1 ribonuclease R [Candidatus Nitrosoglobus terrae]